ncbi:uncharacterized protein LY89DRAFT_540864, partial [Mollisia scopiformis]
RNGILLYLEPQYSCIVRANRAITDYIKDHKCDNGHFDTTGGFYDFNLHSASEAMILLEEYAASFVRDMPHSTRVEIRKMRESYEVSYATMQRELYLDILARGLKAEEQSHFRGPNIELLNFATYFKLAVDEMDRQYLLIRRARRALYEKD